MSDEKREDFRDIWKKFHKRECKCRVCGGIPELVTCYGEYDSWSYIECKCGIKIRSVWHTYQEACDLWEKLNQDSFKPESKPLNIGKPDVCFTCQLKETCTEGSKMNDSDKLSHRCGDYVREIEREC